MLCLAAALIAAAALCVCFGAAAWLGGTGGTGLLDGLGVLGTLGPAVVGAGPGTGIPALSGAPGEPSAAALAAVSWALAQLGTPYRWGGEGAGGFDCSGLVQAAFRAAGVALPRVAQEQFDAGPAVDADAPLEPGDLVFFGTSARAVDHVGIVVGSGDMVDAPHTGAVVRVEPIPTNGYVGATRPAP
jgi:cell wall-associated NlpC family hydrolase